jgi:hypothetical protein
MPGVREDAVYEGNAIVPQVVAVILRVIREIEEA